MRVPSSRRDKNVAAMSRRVGALEVFILLVSVLAAGCGVPAATQDTPQPAVRALRASAAVAPVTYSRDIAPILYEHCVSCHRPANDVAPTVARAGAVDDPICVAGAPFSVLDYESTKKRADAIVRAVANRVMPPWLPDGGQGEFAHERRLSDKEIALIQQWVSQGAPEGNAADRPAPPPAVGGWQLGKPDLVLTLAEPFVLHSGQGDVFRTFVLPTGLTTTRYIRGVELRADNPRVLHHANLAVDPGRVARALDRADHGPGFAVMSDEDAIQNVYGWSPGKVPVLEPPDTAWALEEGADLVVQLHMVAGRTDEQVRPSIGLFFSDRPPTRAPIVVKLESKTIDIPAGDTNYVIEDSYVLPADVDLVSVYPHAHYLAREMRGTAVRPDGTSQSLLRIRQWDVRWQDQYRYRMPVFLPKGTKLSMRFTYDNSAGNPGNRQRPPQRVRWGPLSTDEMGALWLEVIPRRTGDATLLTTDYFTRAQAQELRSAEAQVRSSPRDPSMRNRLATTYLKLGRATDAQRELEEALRLRPDDAEAHSNLGSALQAQGQLAAAIPHLREAVRLKPADDRMHFNLGNGLYAAGDIADAGKEFERAIAINGENAEAHFNLAMMLGPQNRIEDAIAHLHRVLEIAPRNGEAHRNLAVAYGLQGKLDSAIEHARTAVRLMPASAAAHDQLTRLLAARNRLP
jgi:tetratricopeptide (TPR) repeat protein